jgi:pimeloyl-ACP methyl ester carboxylesterase
MSRKRRSLNRFDRPRWRTRAARGARLGLVALASINPNTFSLAQNRNPLELASADVEGDSRIEYYADGEFTFGELRLPAAPGPRPVRPERYADTSPIELLPIGVPQALFAGEMFSSQVPAYRTAADSVAETTETHVVPDAGHFVFIDPLNEEWQQVVTAVRRILAQSP